MDCGDKRHGLEFAVRPLPFSEAASHIRSQAEANVVNVTAAD
jgi:hypothetical protein